MAGSTRRGFLQALGSIAAGLYLVTAVRLPGAKQAAGLLPRRWLDRAGLADVDVDVPTFEVHRDGQPPLYARACDCRVVEHVVPLDEDVVETHVLEQHVCHLVQGMCVGTVTGMRLLLPVGHPSYDRPERGQLKTFAPIHVCTGDSLTLTYSIDKVRRHVVVNDGRDWDARILM